MAFAGTGRCILKAFTVARKFVVPPKKFQELPAFDLCPLTSVFSGLRSALAPETHSPCYAADGCSKFYDESK